MATGRLELCNRIRMEAEDIERTGFPLEVLPQAVQSAASRSEEHTSELQSHA